MSEEKLKVLEMVAEGKISPQDGVRLIEALGEADRAAVGTHRRRFKFDMPDLNLPKIDLTQIVQGANELKKAVVEGAKKAHGQFKRSRASKYFELSDHAVDIAEPEGIELVNLSLDVRAGKLKMRTGDTEGLLLKGKVKRVPDEPRISTEKRGGEYHLSFKQNLGRCNLRAKPGLPYTMQVGTAASDARLNLEELEITELTMDNNAGSCIVRLGELAEKIKVAIDNNAGNIRLRVPDTHAVRVVSTGSLSSDNLAKLGLETVDGEAASSDWDDNERRVDIVVNQNVASFALDWKRRDGVAVEEDAMVNEESFEED